MERNKHDLYFIVIGKLKINVCYTYQHISGDCHCSNCHDDLALVLCTFLHQVGPNLQFTRKFREKFGSRSKILRAFALLNYKFLRKYLYKYLILFYVFVSQFLFSLCESVKNLITPFFSCLFVIFLFFKTFLFVATILHDFLSLSTQRK